MDNRGNIVDFECGLGHDTLSLRDPLFTLSYFAGQAAREGITTKLCALLASGSDVNAKDVDERTALHWAAAAGHLDAVELLIALPGIRLNTQDGAGWTPLMSAVSAGHIEVVSLLLSKGADANVENANGCLEMAELLIDYTSNINKEDHSECSPLMRAIGGEPSRDVVQLLLDHGASLGTRDHDGNTPLHVASRDMKIW